MGEAIWNLHWDSTESCQHFQQIYILVTCIISQQNKSCSSFAGQSMYRVWPITFSKFCLAGWGTNRSIHLHHCSKSLSLIPASCAKAFKASSPRRTQCDKSDCGDFGERYYQEARNVSSIATSFKTPGNPGRLPSHSTRWHGSTTRPPFTPKTSFFGTHLTHPPHPCSGMLPSDSGDRFCFVCTPMLFKKSSLIATDCHDLHHIRNPVSRMTPHTPHQGFIFHVQLNNPQHLYRSSGHSPKWSSADFIAYIISPNL